MEILQILITVARLLAFLCSVVGYVLFARKVLGARIRYSWIFVLSSIACLVYLGGLVGLLQPVTWVLFAGGLVLFVYYGTRKKLNVVFNWQSVNTLNAVFMVVLVLLVVSLYNARFVHYDNFSHWGVVVKDMLMTGRFPTADTAIIDFKTYPLGSSSFLYYFCTIVGHTEGLMLIGQALLILACFLAMFSVVWDRRRLLLSALLGFCFALMSFFNQSIRINNLLVDFLLPSLALAAVAIMLMHRYQFKKLCIFVTPVLGLLVITKNSGLFFAAICYVYLFYIACQAKKYRSKTMWAARAAIALGVVVCTLATFLLWQLHSSIEFKGENTKHTMSVDNFEEVYSEKTPEIVETITDSYLAAVFTPKNVSTVVLVVFNLAALAAYLVARFVFHKRWQLLKWLVVLDIAVVLYYVGIWAMFIFTMPVDEALILAGFERYVSSMVIFFIGALAICAVVDVEKSMHVQQGDQRDYKAFKSRFSKTAYQYVTLLLICLMSITLLSEINGMNSMKQDYETSLPAKVEGIVGDNWAALDGSRYLMYAPDTDRQVSDYYLQYIGRYYLFAPDVDAVSAFGAGEFEAKLREYDYFVVVEPDAALNAQMEKTAGVEALPGVYPVAALLA